jgi:hypothetical protein
MLAVSTPSAPTLRSSRAAPRRPCRSGEVQVRRVARACRRRGSASRRASACSSRCAAARSCRPRWRRSVLPRRDVGGCRAVVGIRGGLRGHVDHHRRGDQLLERHAGPSRAPLREVDRRVEVRAAVLRACRTSSPCRRSPRRSCRALARSAGTSTALSASTASSRRTCASGRRRARSRGRGWAWLPARRRPPPS